MNEQTKTCTKCGETKPATGEFWGKNKGCKYGLDSKCKKCKNVYNKVWQKANLEKEKARTKAWREANPEKLKAYSKRAKYIITKSYIADKLNLPTSSLTPELYEAKKYIILINRKIKQFKSKHQQNETSKQ